MRMENVIATDIVETETKVSLSILHDPRAIRVYNEEYNEITESDRFRLTTGHNLTELKAHVGNRIEIEYYDYLDTRGEPEKYYVEGILREVTKVNLAEGEGHDNVVEAHRLEIH